MGHKWVTSTLGHGDTMCEYCFITNREAAAIGIMNECDRAPTVKPITYLNKDTGQTMVIETQQAMDRFFDNRDPNAWDIVN